MDDLVMYLIHPAIRERLDEWLRMNNIEMLQVPTEDDDEGNIPTYFMSPINFPRGG